MFTVIYFYEILSHIYLSSEGHFVMHCMDSLYGLLLFSMKTDFHLHIFYVHIAPLFVSVSSFIKSLFGDSCYRYT